MRVLPYLFVALLCPYRLPCHPSPLCCTTTTPLHYENNRYINIYGCNSSKFYDDGFLWGSYAAGIYSLTRGDAGKWTNLYCSNSAPNPVIAVVFSILFIMLAALVMLSLFIGAVTMSMTESMEMMKSTAAEADRDKALMKAKKAQEDEERIREELKEQREAKGVKRKLSIKSAKTEELRAQAKMRAILLSAWDGTSLLDLLNQEQNSYDGPAACKVYRKLAMVCDRIAKTASFQNFITLVICVAGVCVGLATYYEENTIYEMRSDADLILPNEPPDGGPFCDWWFIDKSALPDQNQTYTWNGTEYPLYEKTVTPTCRVKLPDALLILDTVILIIFILEVVIKTIAEFDKPWQYFWKNKALQGWNTFDFIVVLGSLLPFGGSLITILRLLRLLRVLKLLKAFPQLQVIVGALIATASSIMYIGIVLILVFYIMGILGMMFFKDNDPWHFGTLHMSMLTLFRCSTLEDWTDVMYINMFGSCNYNHNYNGVWQDGKIPETIYLADGPSTWPGLNLTQGCDYYSYYNNEINSKIWVNRVIEDQLNATKPCGNEFLVEKINVYNSSLYVHADSKEKLESKEYCAKWPPIRDQGVLLVSVIYFVFFTIIAALVLLTLFIGVVTTSMEEASEAQEVEKAIEKKVNDFVKENNVSPDTINMYRMCFEMIDVDGSGNIDEDELGLALKYVHSTTRGACWCCRCFERCRFGTDEEVCLRTTLSCLTNLLFSC